MTVKKRPVTYRRDLIRPAVIRHLRRDYYISLILIRSFNHLHCPVILRQDVVINTIDLEVLGTRGRCNQCQQHSKQMFHKHFLLPLILRRGFWLIMYNRKGVRIVSLSYPDIYSSPSGSSIATMQVLLPDYLHRNNKPPSLNVEDKISITPFQAGMARHRKTRSREAVTTARHRFRR